MSESNLKLIVEAIILAAGKPVTEEQLLTILSEDDGLGLSLGDVRQSLQELQTDYEERGIHLVQVASGYRFQINQQYANWVGKLWEEKAQKYSRALLETLALVAYRQPITRGEIEEIRGVSISSSIFKTLLEEREWIRMVGHKEVPGRPALYATTKGFLDYFGLKSLKELPPLPEIMSMESAGDALDNALPPIPTSPLLREHLNDAFLQEMTEEFAEDEEENALQEDAANELQEDTADALQKTQAKQDNVETEEELAIEAADA